jgi:hypothetical protein
VLGACFWIYWPASRFLADAAHKEYRKSPDGLFTTSVFYNFMMLPVGVFLLSPGLQLPTAHSPRYSEYWDVYFRLASGVGWLGWIIIGIRHLRSWQRQPAFAWPATRLQCWMTDLLAAAFTFGLCMVPCSLFLGDHYFNDATEAICFSGAYLFLAAILGLLVALDLFRHLPMGYSHKVRFVVVIGIILYAALSLLLGCFFAWLTWRRALGHAYRDFADSGNRQITPSGME